MSENIGFAGWSNTAPDLPYCSPQICYRSAQLSAVASAAQVGWGFNSGLLRAAIGGSEFLTSLTIGLGAQINDADLETVSLLCPHLQRLVLRFAMVSETGGIPSHNFTCTTVQIFSWLQDLLFILPGTA